MKCLRTFLRPFKSKLSSFYWPQLCLSKQWYTIPHQQVERQFNDFFCNSSNDSISCKVHIFWEGQKILRNLNFFLNFWYIDWTKLKNHKNFWVVFFLFPANFIIKSEKLLLIIQKASISNYRCPAIKISCPITLVWKSFLDTILQSRSL